MWYMTMLSGHELRYYTFRVRRKLMSLAYRRIFPVAPRVAFRHDMFEEQLLNEPEFQGDSSSPLIISFDDISLMEANGGNMRGSAWSTFAAFMDTFPHLRHTLYFVPRPRYRFMPDVSDIGPEDIYDVTRHGRTHPLIAALRKAAEHGQIEIALHGYEHVRSSPCDYFSAFEFDFLPYHDAQQRITMGFHALQEYFPITGFKPPAWSCGQLQGTYYLADLIEKNGFFQYASLSSPSNGLNYGGQTVSHIHVSQYGKLRLLPQNLSILWDEHLLQRYVRIIVARRGIINIQLHFTPASRHLQDGISKENMEKLTRIVAYAQNAGAIPMTSREAACRV